jgi:thioester reductase-like protein
MTGPIFLTGATGFLGMEVLVRLLERSDREVIALIRAADQEDADVRLDKVLHTLYRNPGQHRAQVRAVRGDVSRPYLGLGSDYERLAAQVDAVIHCAASISFSLSLEDAREINVEGTRSAIAFARQADARLIHVSTAYVAGQHEGTFEEGQLELGQSFRNTYEQTKWEAERLVADADDVEPAVLRPSIVMGESDSGWTPAFNVLYWPLRAFSRGLFPAVPALAHGRVDIVPVDYVTDAIVHQLDHPESGVLNVVAGHDAPTVGELLDMAVGHFDRPRPELVDPGSTGRAATDEHAGVYLPYFDMEVVFDDTRAKSVLGSAGISCPPLQDYFGRLVDYAESTRWGKRTVSREEARERRAPIAA